MVLRRTFAPGVAAFLAAAAVALLGLNASADNDSDRAAGPGSVRLRLLGINDLHGHLEPPRPRLGGVAWLKAHLDSKTLPGRTIRVHAGDMVGASPLISSWFHDEPTVQAADMMGFDVGTLGNHEFDEGGEELLRLLRGGRRTGPEALKRDADGRLVNTSDRAYDGTRFSTIAANTFDLAGRLLLPPYRTVERAGVRVGFIGATTTRTPVWLLGRHAATFRFGDVSEEVNRWVRVLRAEGVEAIVVLAHEGAPRQDAGDPHGRIVDEVRQMHPAVDVVIAGHSHSLLNLRVEGKLVVEALSYGVAYDLVDLTIDRSSGHVVHSSAEVPRTGHAGAVPDPQLSALVEAHRARVGPLAERVVGDLPGRLGRADGDLAAVVAQAQRDRAGADLALVSPASLRADLDAGPVSYEEVFATQAYDHPLLEMELSGTDLIDIVGASRRGGVRVTPLPSIEAGRKYAVVASELLVDRLGGLRQRALSVRAAGSEVEALADYIARRFPR